ALAVVLAQLGERLLEPTHIANPRQLAQPLHGQRTVRREDQRLDQMLELDGVHRRRARRKHQGRIVVVRGCVAVAIGVASIAVAAAAAVAVAGSVVLVVGVDGRWLHGRWLYRSAYGSGSGNTYRSAAFIGCALALGGCLDRSAVGRG